MFNKLVLPVILAFSGLAANAHADRTDRHDSLILDAQWVANTRSGVVGIVANNFRVQDAKGTPIRNLGKARLRIVGPQVADCLLLASQSISANANLIVSVDENKFQLVVDPNSEIPVFQIASEHVASCGLRK